ncbi:hypothetical protein L9F63_001476, partial [Diploptera punctata]
VFSKKMASMGGRGAALLQALQKQHSSQSEDDTTVQKKPAGRGGRGAALLEALLAQQRQPGERNGGGDDRSEQQEERASSHSPTPVPSLGVGRGRAALLASLAAQHTHVGEPSELKPQSPTPGGRGRGMFEALSLQSRGRGIPGSLGQKSPAPASKQPMSPASDRSVESVRKHMAQVSLQEKPPVHKSGESGKEVPATANYIRLFLEPGKGVFEYEVRFQPEVDSQSIRFKMLGQHLDALGGTKTFDGVILYLPIKLQNEETFFTSTHPGDGSKYTLKVIFKKKKRLGECTHLYNVLFRRIMQELKMVLMGRQHFCPENSFNIPQHKLEVWPGYVTAVDEYEGGIQLCCDSSHRVLRTQTVNDLMSDCVKQDPNNFKDVIQKAVIGCIVLTRYNNRTYRVDDIDWSQTPLSTFSNSAGRKISYLEYYKKQYDITILDNQQPMLLHRMKKRIQGREPVEQMICLIPSLCYMTGLRDEMRSDFRVMKDIAHYTRITPNQRQYALKKFINNIQNSERAQAMLAGWGLKLDTATVSLKARVVGPETIYFGNNVQHQGSPQADWGAVSTRNTVLSVVDLERWFMLYTHRDMRFAKDFVMTMHKVGPQMGIQVCEPRMIKLNDDRTDTYINALRGNINDSMQIVVIIFPTNRDDRYSAVKKLCCSERPIASQVINSRTLSRPDKVRSVVQKIALQMNCKLGGSLWEVKIPISNIMVCGIDSYHECQKRSNSVAAFIASTNPSLTRWYSKVCIQGPGQELVDGLKTCFISALNVYYEENHSFPEKIVIYRDGVGDGQLRISAEYEVPQFESCFQHVSSNYHPKLTVVICQKRINTRIFAQVKDGLDNPQPGTIVDHTITRRNWYDFFLVSQFVRQGTVSPTHYVVIHDTSNMKVDHIQRLTYKLCHLYYNWPGTIRVPAPCQYAHKLAQLIGQNVRRPHSDVLSKRLFFL